MKKAVFFDIDGTLLDGNLMLPESTKEALCRLKRNGVYIFLNSGRNLPFIKDPKLKELNFDGILAGCGTYVSFAGEELFYKSIPPEEMKKTLEILEKYDLPTLLEGKRYYYIEKEKFIGDPFLAVMEQEVGEDLRSIREHDMQWDVSKFVAFVRKEENIKVIEELRQFYEVTFRGRMIEASPKGFSKASGIQFICERLGIVNEDTYAFGDSTNDSEMLEYVGHGIAMGNGMPELKAVADYVTNSIHEDGIFNACRYFKLI